MGRSRGVKSSRVVGRGEGSAAFFSNGANEQAATAATAEPYHEYSEPQRRRFAWSAKSHRWRSPGNSGQAIGQRRLLRKLEEGEDDTSAGREVCRSFKNRCRVLSTEFYSR